MSHIIDALARSRLIAVLRLDDYDRAIEISRALITGGVTAIEFTLTGAGAYAAITNVCAEFADTAQIGVGTVLDADAAGRAIEAGAQFVVTPVVRPAVINACRERGVPVLCGAMTPTEVLTAHEAGADIIKIFPARPAGPQYLRDLLGPLPHLRLVPTGGIDARNVGDYLAAGAFAVGIGGSLVPPQAVAQGDWEDISTRARACVEAVRNAPVR